MNFPITSIVWGMIQVALLCGVALILAWIVGGRRPQVISAILGGCCLACFDSWNIDLVATIAVVCDSKINLSCKQACCTNSIDNCVRYFETDY